MRPAELIRAGLKKKRSLIYQNMRYPHRIGLSLNNKRPVEVGRPRENDGSRVALR